MDEELRQKHDFKKRAWSLPGTAPQWRSSPPGPQQTGMLEYRLDTTWQNVLEGAEGDVRRVRAEDGLVGNVVQFQVLVEPGFETERDVRGGSGSTTTVVERGRSGRGERRRGEGGRSGFGTASAGRLQKRLAFAEQRATPCDKHFFFQFRTTELASDYEN